ncbi:MAG TPA: caspase family protein [Kofleriaceae bacterium]|jgi:hypothetical protein
MGRSVVAVIGIDHYAHWPMLTNAVSDARGVLELMTQIGFEAAAPPLLDGAATHEAINELVRDRLTQLASDDRLVVFFAGHGHTVEHDAAGATVKIGYLLPANASDAGSSWLRIDSWLVEIAELPPLHILVVIDACSSGVALGPRVLKFRDLPASASLATLRERRSRRVITSALEDQRAHDSGPVPAHSLFTGYLIEGLSRELAQDGRRFTTGSELGFYLQQKVAAYASSQQTPDFGTLLLDDRGELIIPLLGVEPPDTTIDAPSSPPPPERLAPRTRWIALGVCAAILAAFAAAYATIAAQRRPDAPDARTPDALLADAVAPAPVDAAPPDALLLDARPDAHPVARRAAAPPKPMQLASNPFVPHNGFAALAHPIANDEAAELHVSAHPGSAVDAAAVCAKLGGRLPSAAECAELAPTSRVWESASPDDTRQPTCASDGSPYRVRFGKTPTSVRVQCVR